MKIDSYHIQYNIHTETVIARRGRSPDVANPVSKTHEYQRISDFWVTDSHVAALLGMTGKGFIDTLNSRRRAAVFLYNSQYQNRIQRFVSKTPHFPGKPGCFRPKPQRIKTANKFVEKSVESVKRRGER